MSTPSEQVIAEWARYVAAEAMGRLADQDDAPASGEAYRRRAERTIRQILDEAARDALAQGRPVLDATTEQAVLRRTLAAVCGAGPLQDLLDDPEIENINLTGTAVRVRYADGRREQRPPIV